MNIKYAVSGGIFWMFFALNSFTVIAGEQTENADMAGNSAQVAQISEMAAAEDVVKDWMIPITGEELKDGIYEIQVSSSSAMFEVEECELTVKNGVMTAVMTMSGTGYLKVYMGTGEEAVATSEDAYIPFKEREDGRHTYEVPVDALDSGIACTAYSRRREKWYDRILVFEASSLPDEAFTDVRWTTIEELGLADGNYLIHVSLGGASGKTKVESPAVLEVKDGHAFAEIVFGSANYDYVLIDDEKYELINTEGNSAFRIPVKGFDYDIPIVADSIALGTPREIDYTLFFDSATMKEAEM